ncbi:MAG: hypothetical protein ACYC51_04410, partial [Thermoleophilia bacterium]
MWIFPLVASLIAALFAGAVSRQYLVRHNPAHLAWAVALFIFAVGSACDFIASVSGWTPFLARLYYLTGAVIVVGFLAAGTLVPVGSPPGRACLGSAHACRHSRCYRSAGPCRRGPGPDSGRH